MWHSGKHYQHLGRGSGVETGPTLKEPGIHHYKAMGSIGRDESNLELNATCGNGIGSRRQEADRKKLSPL